MAVGETIVLVLVDVVRVWWGTSAGVGHGIIRRWAVGRVFHVGPCLLMPIRVAIVGVVACCGCGHALIRRHRGCALLHRRGRRPLLHVQLLLHGAHLCRNHLLELLSLRRRRLLPVHQLIRAIFQSICHVMLVLTLILCCVVPQSVLKRGGVGVA